MKRSSYWLGTWLVISLSAHAAPTLDKVIDGDTVVIQDQQQRYHLRLLEIDAPERQQAYGIQSRRTLQQHCQGAVIAVIPQGHDRYGRTLGHLMCDGSDASAYQVSQGMAWVNTHYAHSPAIAALQIQAQQQRLGLWQDAQPVPPWEWRKQYGPHYHRQD